MGYYSDVAITVTKKGSKKFEAKVKEIAKGYGITFKQAMIDAEIREKDDQVVYLFRQTKWYESYFETKSVMEAMRTFGGSYKFIEVGEDYGDITREEDEKEDDKPEGSDFGLTELYPHWGLDTEELEDWLETELDDDEEEEDDE